MITGQLYWQDLQYGYTLTCTIYVYYNKYTLNGLLIFGEREIAA